MISALSRECTVPIEIQAVGAGVGIDAIQHHLDAMGVSRFAHGGKVFFRSQHRVGGLVVAGVIAVGGKTLGNGIQVQNRGAKGGNIVHFLRNAPEITAVKIVIQHQTLFGRLPGNLFVPLLVDRIRFQFSGQVTFPCLVETIRKHLIDHTTLCPIRGGEIRRDTADLPQRTSLHIGVIAIFEQPEATGAGGDAEIIEIQAAAIQHQIALIDIVSTADPLQGHRHGLFRRTVFLLHHNFHRGGIHGGGDMNVQEAILPRLQRAEGQLVLGFFTVIQNTHRHTPTVL